MALMKEQLPGIFLKENQSKTQIYTYIYLDFLEHFEKKC
jgi:hypothetical protein